MRISTKVYLLVLAVVLSASPLAAQKTAAPKAPSKTVVLSVADDMKFSANEITATPGEVIQVRLLAIGTAPAAAMRHNFVLLKMGSNQIAFDEAAAKSPLTDYIPVKMKSMILAQTSMIQNGQSTDVTFKVPTKPGNYPFMCTFPGHMAAGARGKLTVK